MLTACFLLACSQSVQNEVSISGNIDGLQSDTLYLYGMDELRDRIDTLVADNGRFALTTTVDTITPAFLLLNNETEYPLFLDKGNKIKIKGNLSQSPVLTINGNSYNEEYTLFCQQLDTLKNPSESRKEQMVEQFILAHPSSFVSLYLLDAYFVQKEQPDFKKIETLIGNMTGILLDKKYIENLSEEIKQCEKTMLDKYAPYFNLPNAKGKRITRSSDELKQKNLLVHFWASWADSAANARTNQELKALYKQYKKNKHMAFLSISLDMDREEWLKAVRRDTLSWEQVCDCGGFHSEVARQYAVKQLPHTLLLSPNGKILSKDLQGEALKKEIQKAVTESEEKEKKNK